MSLVPPPPAPLGADAPATAAAATAPRVGIVIRTRDRPLFVTRALHSVLAQTFPDWQVVLVNDGGDREVLDRAIAGAGLAPHFAPGRRMRALHHARSVGRSDAFNRGAEALATEFVCCLDDDDTWSPDFLAALVAFFDATRALTPDLGGVAAQVTAIREDIRTIDGHEVLVPQGEDGLPNSFRRGEFFLNPIAYATYRQDVYPVQWMLNRQAALAVGGFPSDFNVMEDRAFMTRFLEHWRLAILDRPLAFHHRRVRRSGDTAQSVVLNTLDNPSYDWRLYADLSRVPVNTGPEAAVTPALLRAVAATLLKEVNDETSALWHKLNGDGQALGARLDRLLAPGGLQDTRLHIDIPHERRHWSLWTVLGDEIGYRLGAGTPFLERLVISMPQTPPGLAAHGSHAQRRLTVQVPQTGDWCALELDLSGLAPAGAGLRIDAVVSVFEGALLESALSQAIRDDRGKRAHRMHAVHVHGCAPGGLMRLRRDFSAAELAEGETPKFSLALPRQALNFRLTCHDLVVSQP